MSDPAFQDCDLALEVFDPATDEEADQKQDIEGQDCSDREHGQEFLLDSRKHPLIVGGQ